MIFNSLAFIIFSLIFYPSYFIGRNNIKLVIILFASYFFYSWWDWRFLGLIIFSTVINYIVGITLNKEKFSSNRKKILFFGVLYNLTILGLFKYFEFFENSLIDLLSTINISPDWPTINIILPLGISFYTFQCISYIIDVYKKRIPEERKLLNLACYIALFPQLVAGPIVRASFLLPQLKKLKSFKFNNLLRGLELIIWGFCLKIVIADNIGKALENSNRFSSPYEFGAPELSSAVIMFSFQIYGDFAGYSLIAIGLGKILGLEFGNNFNKPYLSSSFSEFWKRWHISLSSWLRDYLYIPLGGNRKTKSRTYLNLLITMLLGGLWHGAAWKFLAWGFLHGVYLVLNRFITNLFYKKFNSLQYRYKLILRLFSILSVFLLTSLAWVFFRSNNIEESLYILKTILNWNTVESGKNSANTILILKAYLAILFVLLVDISSEIEKINKIYSRNKYLRIMSAIIILWIIALFGSFSGGEFIYFQF